MATNSIITVDVLNGYLSCKYKAYLRFAGQHGIKSDYEATLVELRQEVRLKAIEKIHHQFPEHTLTSNIALTDSALKRGAYFVLDAQLQDDRFSIHFDALKSRRRLGSRRLSLPAGAVLRRPSYPESAATPTGDAWAASVPNSRESPQPRHHLSRERWDGHDCALLSRFQSSGSPAG